MDKKISDLVDELNRIFGEQGYDALEIGGPVSEIHIDQVEKELNVRFPEDYKNFLRVYGSIRFGEEGVYGIIEANPLSEEFQTALGETNRLRSESFMPHGLVVISGSDYMSFVCINTDSTQQTHKLAYYDSEEKSVYAYTHADSFKAFFEQFLSDTISAYTKDVSQ